MTLSKKYNWTHWSFCRAGRGRCVVAVRDIEPLELVLTDWPVVVGPSRQTQLTCVECLKLVDGSVRCKQCNFPICRYVNYTVW